MITRYLLPAAWTQNANGLTCQGSTSLGLKAANWQRSLKQLNFLQSPKQPTMLHRQGKWEKLPGKALLPGRVNYVARPAGGELAAACLLRHPVQNLMERLCCQKYTVDPGYVGALLDGIILVSCTVPAEAAA